MSTHNPLFAACLVLLAGYGAALAESPNLGKTASPEEIASWDISIGPSGAGLPSGGGTPQQGEQVYFARSRVLQVHKLSRWLFSEALPPIGGNRVVSDHNPPAATRAL